VGEGQLVNSRGSHANEVFAELYSPHKNEQDTTAYGPALELRHLTNLLSLVLRTVNQQRCPVSHVPMILDNIEIC